MCIAIYILLVESLLITSTISLYRIAFKMKILLFSFSLVILLAVGADAVTPGKKTAPVASSKKEVEPSFECPSNYQKQGRSCIHTIVVKPKAKCPKGFTPQPVNGKDGRRRKSQHDNRHSSEDGYRGGGARNAGRHGHVRRSEKYDYDDDYDSGTDYDDDYSEDRGSKNRDIIRDEIECVSVHTVDPIPYCSGEGYKLSEDKRMCMRYTESSPALTCSSDDYQLIGDDCVRTTVHNPGKTCEDPSFTMIGDKCARIVGTEPMEGCPPTYMLENNSCIKIDRMQPFPVCPPRTIPNPNNTETCIEQIVINAKPICPQGFTMIGNTCVKRQVFTPEKHCEGDASMLGPECITEIVLEANYKCPDGFVKDPSGSCIMRRDPVPFCEDGILNPITEQCESRQSVLPAVECPRGWELTPDEESCVKIDQVPVEYECPRGYKVNGSECVLEEEVMPDLQCPETFTLVEDKCVRPLYKKKWQKCQKGFELIADRCVATEEIMPSLVCPNGFELKLNKCVQLHSVAPSENCPPGAKLKGSKCIISEEQRPEKECNKGYAYNRSTGYCEEQEIVAVNYRCPRGFIKNKGECIKTQQIAPTPRCPDNHHYDNATNSCVANQKYVPVLPPPPPPPTPTSKTPSIVVQQPSKTHSLQTISSTSSSKKGNTVTTYLDVPSSSYASSSYGHMGSSSFNNHYQSFPSHYSGLTHRGY